MAGVWSRLADTVRVFMSVVAACSPMVRVIKSRSTWPEQWTPHLFLLAGVFLIGHAGIMGIRAFTDLVTPPDVFVMTGHLLALAALLGLSPMLAERSPRLVRGATYVCTLTLTGWAVLSGIRFLALLDLMPPISQVVPGVFLVLILATMALTYTMYGIAAGRSATGSRTMAFVVLAPGMLLLILLVKSALVGSSGIGGFLIAAGLAVAMLTLGYSLRSWHRPPTSGAATDQRTPG